MTDSNISVPRAQLEYIHNALRSVERYGNIFNITRHEVSPYDKVLDALAMTAGLLDAPRVEETTWDAALRVDNGGQP